MATEKIFNVIKHHRDRMYVYTGTLRELVECFKYTLECGNSWNPKISLNPKTIKSLISNLEKSVQETQGSCYNQDCYDLKTDEDIEKMKANLFNQENRTLFIHDLHEEHTA